jgi:hypothetical protein
MKTKIIFTALFISCFIQLFAQQHALVGTWEFVSGKGTSADGNPIAIDRTRMSETKIFSPTHFMYIASTVKGDSMLFNRAVAGTWRVEGNKYFEIPTMSSQEGPDKSKTEFTWKVEGDKFIRQGVIIQPDGKKMTIDELVFQRVDDKNAPKNPGIGTWNQLSSSGQGANGEKWSHTNATHIRFQLVSPTHWMRMSFQNNVFENAMGGTYHIKGNKVHPTFQLVSSPMDVNSAEVIQRVEGNKLYWSGTVKDIYGKTSTFEDVFEKAPVKTSKTASVK